MSDIQSLLLILVICAIVIAIIWKVLSFFGGNNIRPVSRNPLDPWFWFNSCDMRGKFDSQDDLKRALEDMGITTEWEIAAGLGKKLNVPFINLSKYEIDKEVINSIPREIARKYKIVPVDKSGNTLTIAMADPSNIYILDELRLLTKYQIIPVISLESDITTAINRYYGDPCQNQATNERN